MSSDDCVVINITPGKVDTEFYECPMCGGDIYQKNMASTCKNKIPGHDVCLVCQAQLSEKFYENGIGCVYCGDPKTKTPPEDDNVITIPTEIVRRGIEHQPVVIVQRNSRGGLTWTWYCDRVCQSTSSCLAATFVFFGICIIYSCALAALYAMCNIIYTFTNALHHVVEGENHMHASDWSVKHAVYGFGIMVVASYILVQIYLILDVCAIKICYDKYSFCAKKYKLCVNKIRSSQICNLLYVCLTCEALSLPDEEGRTNPSVTPSDSDSE